MPAPNPKKPSPAARAAEKRTAEDARAPAPKRAEPAVAALHAAMVADLARSGLTAADAQVMRLRPLEKGARPDIAPPGAGYVIPYFSLDGAPRIDMFRYRYLEDTRGKGFAVLGSRKARRYTQPPHTPPGVYWPPFTRWDLIAADPAVPLVVTEGEKKSAVATKMGLPTVGLGGVWSFRSKSLGVRLLPELKTVSWEGRSVMIAYDSDAALNSDVCRAELALAEELVREGAMVKVVRLPELVEGEKCALDDYLVAEGVDRFVELAEATEPFALGRELHKLNSEVIYVQDPGFIYVRGTAQIVRPHDFIAHRYADRQYARQTVDPKGMPKMEVRQLAPDWVKWPQRATATKLVFSPGEDEITTARELNTWKGWSYLPLRGDVKPWNELLDFLFEGEPESRAYFEAWAAYPIQFPGVKLRNAVALWGIHKGTGKSVVGYTLGDLYGDAFYEIDDTHIDGSVQFNEWAKNRQLVMGDEITGNDSRRVANKIKHIITRETVEINSKGVPQYKLVDRINYYFTSNAPDCFYMEEDERRIFIHEVRSRALPDEFYARYDKWRRSEAGRRALMYHLLYEVDTSEFNPMARPPDTLAKLEMIANTRTELESWLIGVRDHPEIYLKRFGNSDLITITELGVLHESEGYKKASPNLLARKLKELGLDPLYPSDNPQRAQLFAGGKLVRLYALRNIDKWRHRSTDELRREYERSRGMGAAADKKQKF